MKEEREKENGGRRGVGEEEKEKEKEKGSKLTSRMILEETREEPEKATSLDFHNRSIGDISILKRCEKLKKLDLSFNLVSSLEAMRSLKQLKVLRLYNNRLDNLEGVQYLINLQVLTVDSNNLTSLAEIRNLKFLHELSAAFNSLSEIRPGHLPNSLRLLDVSSNGIEKLQGLAGLIRLQQLSINNNKLTDLKGLPPSPCQLKEIYASGNEIKSLKGLEKYSDHIDIIRMEDNHIKSFSNLTRSFEVTTELHLAGNKISELQGIENFENVEILDLCNNHLYDVDGLQALNPLDELRDLKVEGNPFGVGQGEDYRSKITAILPKIECIDDRDVESSPSTAPLRTKGPSNNAEGMIQPRAPAGARPSTPRRPLSATKISSLQNGTEAPMMHARPMSARAGSGTRLLTATQYEVESKAFEEQVFGYQNTMTKLLREMKSNLELPLDEITSIVKASGEEALTASLPEPPVIGTIKQHKESSSFGIPRERQEISLEKIPKRSGKVGSDTASIHNTQKVELEKSVILSGDDRYSRPSSSGEVEEYQPGSETRTSRPPSRSREPAPIFMAKPEQYEYLKEQEPKASEENYTNGMSNASSPKDDAAKHQYKGFQVPARPLSARKNSQKDSGKVEKTKPKSSNKVALPRVSKLKRNTFKLKT